MVEHDNICRCDICDSIYSLYKGRTSKSLCNSCLTIWRAYEQNRTYLDEIMPHLIKCRECGEEFIYPVDRKDIYCKSCYYKHFRNYKNYNIQDLAIDSSFAGIDTNFYKDTEISKGYGYNNCLAMSDESRDRRLNYIYNKYSDYGMTIEEVEAILPPFEFFRYDSSSYISRMCMKDIKGVVARLKEAGWKSEARIGKYIDTVIEGWHNQYVLQYDERLNEVEPNDKSDEFKKGCLNLYLFVCEKYMPVHYSYIKSFDKYRKEELETLYSFSLTYKERKRVARKYRARITRARAKERQKEANKNGL